MNKINIGINIDKPSNDQIKTEIQELEKMISQTIDQEKLRWLNSCLLAIKNSHFL